jgi:hypothetical protein
MRREHDVGMCGRDSCVKNRAQEGTSVGHDCNGSYGQEVWLSIQTLQKKTPAACSCGGCPAREWVDWLFELLERFRAKACPGLDPGWTPVRVKKTRQTRI